MEKHLKTIYKEEFIRAKARNDFQKSLQDKQKLDNSLVKVSIKYATAFTYILLGGVGFFALYQIYWIFM